VGVGWVGWGVGGGWGGGGEGMSPEVTEALRLSISIS
jgi:hypothetical protein